MSIDGNYDPDNIFAKILRGEMPCVKVFENDNILAFMDAFPQSKGHTLVIPKSPCRNILDAGAKDLGRLIGTTQTLSRAINTALSPDGITVTQFTGAFAGQTVFHLHFHIIPRYQGKVLGNHGGGMADMAELQATADKIIAEI